MNTKYPVQPNAPWPLVKTEARLAEIETPEEPTSWQASWPVLRAVLIVWALAVWLLLVMLPGIDQIHNLASAMMHLPNVLIGLVLLAAMVVAYSLKLDGHLLWFLMVLLLLAGWM